MASNEFYYKLAKLRFITFAVVGTLGVLFSGWRRGWVDWPTILFEAAIIAFTAMFLSLPLAWIRTKLKMDQEKRKRDKRS